MKSWLPILTLEWEHMNPPPQRLLQLPLHRSISPPRRNTPLSLRISSLPSQSQPSPAWNLRHHRSKEFPRNLLRDPRSHPSVIWPLSGSSTPAIHRPKAKATPTGRSKPPPLLLPSIGRSLFRLLPSPLLRLPLLSRCHRQAPMFFILPGALPRSAGSRSAASSPSSVWLAASSLVMSSSWNPPHHRQ